MKRENLPTNDQEMSKSYSPKLWHFIVIAIVICLVLVVITYFFFTFNGTIPIGNSLHKEDWLLFWGSCLGFLGTCIFGAITLWQNYTLHQVNKVLTEQNAVGNFHSLIIPNTLEIEIDKISQYLPVDGPHAQIVRLKGSEIYSPCQFIKFSLFFNNVNDFYPNEYLILSIEIKGNPEIILTLPEVEVEKNKQFYFPYQSSRTSSLMNFLYPVKDANKFFKGLKSQNKLSINFKILIKNSFSIESTYHYYINFKMLHSIFISQKLKFSVTSSYLISSKNIFRM